MRLLPGWIRLLRATVALSCVLGAGAPAQPDAPVRRGRMYLSSGLLVGSTRLVSLGGAYVGIAEGAAAFTSNLATLAHRKPSQSDDWAVDVAVSYVDIPLGNPAEQDFDNNGISDQARLVRQLASGLFLQFRNFGVGGYNRTTFLRYCLLEPCSDGDTSVILANDAIAGAMALGADEVILALGLYSTTGEFRRGSGVWTYGSFGLTFDALVRPVDRNFRIGLSLKPQVAARLLSRAGDFGGRIPFEALVSPFVASLGGSVRLGPGSERYNRLSVAKLRELGIPAEEQEGPPSAAPAGRWLLTAQLDVLAPVEDAVPIRSFVDQGTPPVVARRTQLAVRAGVEHETLPGRLRLRAGSYLEPSPFEGRPPRLHATGGFELFLLRHIENWALSFSFDFADRYSDFGASIGFWR